MHTPGIQTILDYTKMHALAAAMADTYQHANPFPHIVLDDFLDHDVIRQILQVFPVLHEREGQRPTAVTFEDVGNPQYNKLWMSNQLMVDLLIRQIYWELNSSEFLYFLEQLTGIDNLLPDPHLNGGGVHEVRRDGMLLVHADFNKHPNFGLDRRLNLLIYLNEDWLDEYGGHLELWERDLSQCVKRVLPVAGRCVIFSTNRDSFHGHPHPLTCPPERSRKSIAMYYYTKGRSLGEDDSPHKTLWRKTI